MSCLPRVGAGTFEDEALFPDSSGEELCPFSDTFLCSDSLTASLARGPVKRFSTKFYKGNAG